MATRRLLSFWIALSAVLTPLHVSASTIVVSSTGDDVTLNGNCTLREAVIAANTDAGVDACLAGSATDTVVLPAGTYRLSLLGNGEDASQSGDLDVHSPIALRGAGAAATIIEGGSSGADWLRDRVLHVSEYGSLTLSRLTVRGGYCASGGGVLNAGELFVTDSRIEGNDTSESADCAPIVGGFGGAGILNASTGWLVMTASSVSGNRALGPSGPDDSSSLGGGLMNFGLAQISGSLFAGDFAAAGGGIVNMGGLEVGTSHFDGNYSRFDAAAFWNLEDSTFVRTTFSGNAGGSTIANGVGGIIALLRLENSTVSGNWSFYGAGSVVNEAGSLYITSSTIAGNGDAYGIAGIGGLGRTELRNSIVFNPPDAWAPNGDCMAPVISRGHNIDGDGSCGLAATGDLPVTNPLLGALANNGGPTPTHALLPGSPAIDRIPSAFCTVPTDQRGVLRPYAPIGGGACDVGAYEFSPQGDLGLIAQDVQRLTGLAEQYKTILLQSLKPAVLAASHGDYPAACAALGVFESTVTSYVQAGRLSAQNAAALLAGVDRVQAMICQ